VYTKKYEFPMRAIGKTGRSGLDAAAARSSPVDANVKAV